MGMLLDTNALLGWEAEIKRALGKLAFEGDVDEKIRANGFIELPLEVTHATALRSLGSHHRGPCDRMLVAQAMLEGCTLVTADTSLAKYGVDVLDARQ